MLDSEALNGTVLVTGAFGLVGLATVRHLLAVGATVVATDLDTPAARKTASDLTGADIRWADLTDPRAVETLVSSTKPRAIIHLAAVIPPTCYARPDLAHKVNVGATDALLRAAQAQVIPPRFVQASSIAVYGPRNPHRHEDVLTAQTPLAPVDVYGSQKAEAERLVRASDVDWVILRFGGVMTARPRMDLDRDLIYFEGLLPSDGRIQTVDVRDVARAVGNATTAAVVGETLLIAGDSTHRITQRDVGTQSAAAMGLAGGLPGGRNGDSTDDDGWFATDWMDTTRAQELLDFQRHPWPAMLAETRRIVGWKRALLRVAAPFVRWYLSRRSPYRNSPGKYADPWGAIAANGVNPSRKRPPRPRGTKVLVPASVCLLTKADENEPVPKRPQGFAMTGSHP